MQDAVTQATARLKHKDIVDRVCIGRHGLGFGVADENQRWGNRGRQGQKENGWE